MKTVVSAIVIATSVIATSVIATGADKPVHRVEIKKIETQIQQTPQLQVSGVKNKNVVPRYWLEIEAELEVETTDKSKFIPELKARWYAIVRDKFEEDDSKKSKMLTGEVLFRNVRTKDGRAYLVAYIGPDDLEKLTGEDRPGEGDVEGVALLVSGEGIVDDPKYAPGLQFATAQQKHKWWANPRYPTMEGLIVAKSKTPFAPLWTDRYPTEKPE